MSHYRSEANSRSAVKTELTVAHLECLPISLASDPSVTQGCGRFATGSLQGGIRQGIPCSAAGLRQRF
jgi:hypothetical protein